MLNGFRLPAGEDKKLWKTVVLTVQCQCTYSHKAIHLEVVKFYVIYVFHNYFFLLKLASFILFAV